MKRMALLSAIAMTVASACATPPAEVTELLTREDSSLQRILVRSPEGYAKIAKNLKAGDTVVLANGVWRDFDLVIQGQGTAESPIQVVAEEPGQVILSGQSSLRLGGNHIIVSGLVFRDGYTPRNEVISFRIDRDTLANNSRVTQTVIENYNNPERALRDTWVVMYGRGNEFDRNHLSGKLNSGPTMTVRLNTEESRNNGHKIHHNYFGPRPVFGSNGGETLRIGTSHYSLTTSNTLVESNYFDRCSGEVEIVSNKSGGNTYRDNTFFESRGTLTLRHGNGTIVENNLFDGNGALYTGGVRVINAQQTIRNNYFKDLTGTRFSGALVVMNGVPDSPINRYHQVDGANITGNTFDTVSAIELAEGSDTERSAVPINSSFENNIVLGATSSTPFNLYDDMSGVTFAGNITDSRPPEAISRGFSVSETVTGTPFISKDGDAGADGEYGVDRNETGVEWFPKPSAGSPFETGQVTSVLPGEGTIAKAVKKAASGDILLLSPGAYNEARIIDISRPLTIRAADSSNKPVLSFERSNMFKLSKSGALRLDGVSVSGASAPDAKGNSFIATSARAGVGNLTLEILNSDFDDFMINGAFAIVTAEKGTFFDVVKVSGATFKNISGDVFKFNSESDDYGIYNVEYMEISDTDFSDIRGSAVSIYRGGRDESTFGPYVKVTESTFTNVGNGSQPMMVFHGAQSVEVTTNLAENSAPAEFVITTGIPKTIIEGNRTVGPPPSVFLTTTDMRQ